MNPSGFKDRTFSVTVGKYGGFYAARRKAVPGWRLCLGFIAFTWSKGDIDIHEALRIGFDYARNHPEVEAFADG